jgi:DNA-binding transcriptional ArsR family regulator
MKGALLNQDVLWVDDPEAAKALTDKRMWTLLSVFINHETSLKVAAGKLKMSLPALSYRVRKLLDLGLLEVSRIEKRKGSPIKYYRTVAEHFFVPFRMTSSDTLESLLESISAGFEKRFRRELARVFLEEASEWGLNLYGGADGDFNYSFSPAPERDEVFVQRSLQPNFPAVYDNLFVFAMDFDTAKALQRDIDGVYQRYAKVDMRGQQVYLLQMRLVPVGRG